MPIEYVKKYENVLVGQLANKFLRQYEKFQDKLTLCIKYDKKSYYRIPLLYPILRMSTGPMAQAQ